MQVADLMTKNVIAVHPETTLADAARIMLAQHVSGLPVVDAKGALVGMVTEGDLLCRTELDTAGKPASWLTWFLSPGRLADNYVRTHGRHVSEVMTSGAVTVMPNTALAEAARLMRDKRLKRLPVVESGRLVGVISRSDMLRALAPKLAETSAAEPGTTIKTYIQNALAKEKWAPRAGLRIEVKGDVVDLEGVIFSENERQAVKVVAENAPGVREVHDHLMFVDPSSGAAFATYWD